MDELDPDREDALNEPPAEGPGPDDVALPGLEAAPQSGAGYQVLARKYRPQNFDDLIGQDAMVRTLTNAFAAGRIAHAYMLTGVRGVGKTTTARLIARALNYRTAEADAPSMVLNPPGEHCERIAQSSHVDVMEMDAASRTGVGDIREILEGVRYSPVSARYKVYIIDEVHMLSTSAFNALLKTLEEPPAHVKFIFATTEIRKVPVTVLSRCQRFDLKRVERDVLTDHLARICDNENARVERDGLVAIARAAEGSVRDALSLLDQAIVQGEDEGAVSALQVREMLGLADRARVLDLLEAVLEGQAGAALGELREQYDRGADPQVLVRDVLDHLHAMSRLKAAGPEADLGEAAETQARLQALADKQTLASLARLWKVALGGLDDVRVAPDPVAAAEMAMIRLMAAADLPSPEDAARLLSGQPPKEAATAPAPERGAPATDPGPQALADPVAATPPAALQPETTLAPIVQPGSGGTPPSAPAPDGREEAGASLHTIDDLADMIDAAREIRLLVDVRRFVRLVALDAGKLVFEPADGAPDDLSNRLAAFLKEQTGARWLVDGRSQSRGGETLEERRHRLREEKLEAGRRDPAVQKALELFPGAELLEMHESAASGDVAGDGAQDEPETPRQESLP
ncbi:MAG: DNA polymerase III subunit gamma/tau [Pseudomonadota bacterium]